MCNDTDMYSTFMNTALLTNPSPLPPSCLSSTPWMSEPPLFTYLEIPLLVSVERMSIHSRPWLMINCQPLAPQPSPTLPSSTPSSCYMFTETYRDDITTSVTLSDTFGLSLIITQDFFYKCDNSVGHQVSLQGIVVPVWGGLNRYGLADAALMPLGIFEYWILLSNRSSHSSDPKNYPSYKSSAVTACKPSQESIL
jgi:hypothetical protein